MNEKIIKTKEPLNRQKKKLILVDSGVQKKLSIIFGCSQQNISNILNYKSNGKKSRKIRAFACREFDGKKVVL